MRGIVYFVLFAVLGGVLMFVGHFFAFLSSINHVALPYWWSYVLLYPLAAFLAVRLRALGPLAAAAAVCLLPACYFVAIGVFDSNWHTSSTAVAGIGIAFVLALACAMWARQARPSAI